MIVYRLTCIPTGKIYIGITRRTLERRVAQHFADANRQKWPDSRWLFTAMGKFQRTFWTIEVLARAGGWQELLDLERVFIARYRSNDPSVGYNRTAGGQGTLGMKQSPKTEEQRMKVGLFHRGRKRPDATRELLRQHALRRWRENPEQFPKQIGNLQRDIAIARRYFYASSYDDAAKHFGIRGPAACEAVQRAQASFRDWVEACGHGANSGLPKRLDPSWIEMMELSL